MTAKPDPYDDAVLRPLEGPITEPFDCGIPFLNEFLRHAWDQQTLGYSRTYLLYVKGILAGFMSVAMGQIRFASTERPAEAYTASLPAVYLVEMAVDNEFRLMGYGKYLVNSVIAFARKLADLIGCRYVMLDARYAEEDPERPLKVRDFYADRGFVINQYLQNERIKDANKGKRDPNKLNVSMRFDLRPPGAEAVMPPSSE